MNLAYQPLKNKRYLLRVKQGLIWLSSFSLLSGGIAVAQTQLEQKITPPDPVSQPATAVESLTSTPSPEAIESLPAPSEPPLLATPSDISTTAPTDTSDSYIDSTPYNLGATDQEKPVVIARPTRRPIIAPSSASTNYSINANSVSVTPPGVAPTSSYIGNTTASGMNYFRKLRYPIKPNNGISLIFPLSIPAPITSLFGWRIHPISGMSRFHSGTDIGAPLRTPVLAAYTGQVQIADFLSGYGLSVSIKHQNGTKDTLYAHLSEVFVKPGQWVKQGDVIGYVGSTGTATGPNLHFELRQLTSEGWVVIDPGTQLESALAELVLALQTTKSPSQAQAKPKKQVANGVSSVGTTTKPNLPFELRQSAPKSWVALNPGGQLEYALAQLLKALRSAKLSS